MSSIKYIIGQYTRVNSFIRSRGCAALDRINEFTREYCPITYTCWSSAVSSLCEAVLENCEYVPYPLKDGHLLERDFLFALKRSSIDENTLQKYKRVNTFGVKAAIGLVGRSMFLNALVRGLQVQHNLWNILFQYQ